MLSTRKRHAVAAIPSVRHQSLYVASSPPPAALVESAGVLLGLVGAVGGEMRTFPADGNRVIFTGESTPPSFAPIGFWEASGIIMRSGTKTHTPANSYTRPP